MLLFKCRGCSISVKESGSFSEIVNLASNASSVWNTCPERSMNWWLMVCDRCRVYYGPKALLFLFFLSNLASLDASSSLVILSKGQLPVHNKGVA